MALVLKDDIDMIKMYYHTKNEVSTSTASKDITQTDSQYTQYTHIHTEKNGQTHKHYENVTSPAHAGGKNTKSCR